MKRIYYFLLLIFLVSCTDSVLDKQPLDTVSDAYVWKDKTLLDAYITGVYTRMYVWDKDMDSDANARTWFYTYIDYISDESPGTAWKQGGININTNLLPWWERAYEINRDLNIMIERIPTAEIDDAAYKTARLAETRFLRAYNYFLMVIRYGGVPLITKAQSISEPDEELYRTRNSEKEIYDFIISECDAIYNDLPSTPEVYGKPTKWTVAALKCRAALYAGSIAQFGTQQMNGLLGFPASEAQSYYQKAYDAANVIKNGGVHSLYNKYPTDKVKNFRQIFLEDKNSEVIFARIHNNIDSYPGNGQGWSINFFQGPRPNSWGGGRSTNPYLELVDEFENIVTGTPGMAAPLNRAAIQQGLWSGQDLFGNKEPRFFATIFYQDMVISGSDRFTNGATTPLTWYKGIIKEDGTLQDAGSYKSISTLGNQVSTTDQGTGFGVWKYIDETHPVRGPRMNSPQDWKLFRYGEVLLNLAEAAFELGKTTEALNAINEVRVRAGVAPLTSIDRMKIRHERKIELAFEGHRYWDLRRWRTAVTELTRSFSGLRFQLDYTTRKYKVIVIENYEGTANPPKFFEHNYYFPLTLSRTGNNPSLVENPGYE